jgi:hypothetical protein
LCKVFQSSRLNLEHKDLRSVEISCYLVGFFRSDRSHFIFLPVSDNDVINYCFHKKFLMRSINDRNVLFFANENRGTRQSLFFRQFTDVNKYILEISGGGGSKKTGRTLIGFNVDYLNFKT